MARILVVDNDVDFRLLVKRILERKGYEALEAENGKEACRFVRENELPLMVTDIVMPEMEGIETIREVRKMAPDIKIIAMSGSGVSGPAAYLSVARKLGADYVFEKPFDMHKFLDVVQYLLSSN